MYAKERFGISLVLGVLVLVGASNVRAEEKVVELFNGKNLDGWTFKGPTERSKWAVGVAHVSDQNPGELVLSEVGDKPGEMVSPSRGVDIYTVEKFGDCTISLEFMIPKGSNSGVYVMGEYEVQILDSYGKEKVGPGDLGGLYSTAAPRVNASRKPGEWQSFVIEFQAPRFVAEGKKTSNAKFVKVILNGETIHENIEMKGPTPSGITGKEAATGPLMFQGDHGPVAFRAIRVSY